MGELLMVEMETPVEKDMIEKDVAKTAGFQAAEMYEQFMVPYVFRYWTPQLLKRAVPQPGERVLDVACGTGVVARSIVPLVGDQGKVVGLDINPMMLAVACRQYSDNCDKIDWREGQAENIPFAEHDFDLVTCQQGLQFFKDRAKAAREMHRVLKPNGRAVIEVFQSIERNEFYKKVFDTLAEVFNVPVATLATPYSFGDPTDLEGLFIDAGFKQVKVEQVRQEAHFKELDRFVERQIKAAAAVIPAFGMMDDESLSGLQKIAQNQLAGTIADHSAEGVLIFPMYTNFATAIM